MNRRTVKYAASVFLLLLSTLLIASPQSEQKKQLDALRDRMQQVEKTLRLKQRTQTQEEKQLRQIDKRLNASSKKLHVLNKKLAVTRKNINGLHVEQKVLKKGINKQKSLLGKQMKSAYLMGQQQRVKMLLNQEEPDRMSRVMQYYDYFNQARLKSVKQLESDIAVLLLVEEKLAGKQHELTSFVSAKRLENETLAKAKKQRKAALSQLNRQIKTSSQELAELKENEKRLTNLLASIQQAVNNIPVPTQASKPFRVLKGKMNWPTKGRILKRFGSARKSGRYDGVVISANEGAAIRSISNGRVVYADWLRGYGLLMIIDHGANYMSLYAFNEGLYKEAGDWVRRDETIGTVGVSGGQNKAGLYFSIRKNGKPVNPVHWCKTVRKGRVG
ncbi:MAG: peptidase M23 [Cycloclasticus sp. symbiont of Poecilosclerida sp. N]|nr:MAG: peptidase M23 [Cycloclasticus sp. symbiont of Poecilosclerida sp. N]